jgi:hypothetical protein
MEKYNVYMDIYKGIKAQRQQGQVASPSLTQEAGKIGTEISALLDD